MYYIPVCGMYASYICTDIMHASYYSVYIDGYAILKTCIHAIYLKNHKVTALLKMVCITYQYVVCMHSIYVLISCMHPVTVYI